MNPNREPQLPEFIREALEEDAVPGSAKDTHVLLPAFHELLPPADTSSGAQRLVDAVSELPWRYAPFFSRVAELWDRSEDDVVAVFEKARLPSSWRNPGLPGLRVIDVQGGPKTAGAEVHLARFEAGMRFPRHRHPGPEALFVLEGDYTDSSGRLVGPGELQTMNPESVHSFKIGKTGPCVAASVQTGREFTGPLMRIFAKLMG